jgi:autotransporter-associated beta strand protein
VTAVGLPGLSQNSNFQDFYLVPSTTLGVYDTLYTLTATSNTVGTISKYFLTGGTWTSAGSFSTGVGGFGLAARANPSGFGIELFMTTGQGAQAANSVVRYVDVATGPGVQLAISGSTTVASATGTAVFKGIEFAPGTSSISLPRYGFSGLIWGGANGATWNTTSSIWTNGQDGTTVQAFATGSNALFTNNGSGTTVAVQTGGVSAGSVTIQSRDVTFTGGPIALTAGNTLTKVGPGTLTFQNVSSSGSNSFGGVANLGGGTVVWSRGEQLGNPGDSVALSGGVVLQPAASATLPQAVNVTGPATLSKSADLTLRSLNILAGGAFTNSGTGNLTINDLPSQATTGVFATSGGTVTLNALRDGATLNLSGAGSNSFNSSLVIANRMRLNFNGGSVAGTGSVSFQITNTAAGTTSSSNISIVGNNSRTSLGLPLLLNAATPALAASDFVLNIGASSGNTLVYSGNMSGNAFVNYAVGRSGGAGLLVLAGNSTYKGESTLNMSTNGVLRLGVGNALPTDTVFKFNTADFGSSTNSSGGSGTLDLAGYDQSLASIETGGGNATGVGSKGAISNSAAGVSTLTLGGTRYDDATPSAQYDGTIAGNVSLVKTGVGTQTLTGALTLTGNVTVNGGTLELAGTTVANAPTVTVAGGLFKTGGGYSVPASQTLVLAGGSVQGAITGSGAVKTAGSGTFTVPNAISAASVEAAGPSDVTFGGAITSPLFKVSGGTARVAGADVLQSAAVSVTGGTLVLPGNTLASYVAVSVPSLSVSGGTVQVPAATGKPGVLVASSLSLTGGTIDLTNNDMIFPAGTASESDVRTWLRNWYANQAGASISTSAGVAGYSLSLFVNNDGAGNAYYTLWDGVPVGANDLIVNYGVQGDVNLDGVCDGKDFRLAMEGAIFGDIAGINYRNLEVNFDGVVNGDDLGVIAAQAGNGLTSDNGQGTGEGTTTAIPEPGAMGVLLAAMPLVSRRRRAK